MHEYTPTVEERENTLMRGDFLKLSGDGIFATLQGEGVTAGEPAVFLRLQDCNLQCGADEKGWRCDAWYTWDRTTPEYWQETKNVGVSEVADQVVRAWDATFDDSKNRRLVITGGEPLLQQRQFPKLFDKLSGWQFEIETNGTIIPSTAVAEAQVNCSPKLATSGNSRRARYRPQALRAIRDLPNSWFKFVVSDFDTDPTEITAVINDMGINSERVLLMGEGSDPEVLTKNHERLERLAQTIGCTVTKRNHIFWFGDKRGT